MPLTDATIRVLKPKVKPYKVSDFEGLFMTVKPTGSRLWHFKYRIDGKEKLLSIGVYPEITLAQARGKKDEARALLASGKDPGDAKKDQQRQDAPVGAIPLKSWRRSLAPRQSPKAGRLQLRSRPNGC
jgi:hypothetical protein